MDRLEEIYPEPLVYPPGLKQQTLARLFDVLVDGLLGRPAWHCWWNCMEENYGFIGREFSRSFKPQGSNEEIDRFGEIIGQRTESKRSGMGASEEALPVFESFYLDVLEVREHHFVTTLYLFGGKHQ